MYVGWDTDALSFRELEDELATLAAHLYAGTCRWLELVAELDRRGDLAGCTCSQWLAWRCGLAPRAAREHVRIARRARARSSAVPRNRRPRMPRRSPPWQTRLSPSPAPVVQAVSGIRSSCTSTRRRWRAQETEDASLPRARRSRRRRRGGLLVTPQL